METKLENPPRKQNQLGYISETRLFHELKQKLT